MNTKRRGMMAGTGYLLPVLMVGALWGGCGPTDHQKEEAARKAAAARQASEFAAFAKKHGALVFEPSDHLGPLTGQLTIDAQRKVTAGPPIAISLILPDVRIVGGQVRLCSRANTGFGWAFELEVNEEQVAVARGATELWVIARIESTDAREELSTTEGQASRDLIVRCVGKAIVCRRAPD